MYIVGGWGRPEGCPRTFTLYTKLGTYLMGGKNDQHYDIVGCIRKALRSILKLIKHLIFRKITKKIGGTLPQYRGGLEQTWMANYPLNYRAS